MAFWYTFMGGDPLAASSYRKTSYNGSTNPSCTTGCKICAVFLNETAYYPTTPFTTAQINSLIDALADGQPILPVTGFKVRLKVC